MKSSNKIEKQDCKLYDMSEQGVLDESKIIMEKYTMDCVGDATYFAHTIAEFIEISSKNALGFNKFLFRSSPDEKIAALSKKNIFGLSFLIANSTVMKDLITTSEEPQAVAWQKKFIPYPVTTYVVKDGDTLWDVAEEISGSGDNWPVIWVLNGDKLPTARDLVAGQHIAVPAVIENWEYADIQRQGIESISLERYQTKELTSLVGKICADAAVLSAESYCFLPKFSNASYFKNVCFGIESAHVASGNP